MNRTKDSFASLCSNHNLPGNWTSVVDHGNRLNFIRLENWAYHQNRVKTELSVTKRAPGEFNYSISCPGKEIEIDNLLEIDQHPCRALLDKSSLCRGVPVEKGAVKSSTIMITVFTVIRPESLWPTKSTEGFQQIAKSLHPVVHAASAVVAFSIL